VNTCVNMERPSAKALRGRSPVTYFDHDHRERENVGFLAVCPLLLQDLWRHPPWGVVTLKRGALDRIQVLSDHSEAEIHNARMTRVVHKDVCLARG